VADAFDLGDLVAALAEGTHDFAEFFRSPVRLPQPHRRPLARRQPSTISSRTPRTRCTTSLGSGGPDDRARARAAGTGSVAFVAAGVDHRFSEIDEDLEVLVFWSPARHTKA
jgi:hypothetical protein